MYILLCNAREFKLCMYCFEVLGILANQEKVKHSTINVAA